MILFIESFVCTVFYGASHSHYYAPCLIVSCFLYMHVSASWDYTSEKQISHTYLFNLLVSFHNVVNNIKTHI